MEVLSCHSALCCHVSSLRGITAEKSIDFQRTNLLSARNHRVLCIVVKSEWGSSRYRSLGHRQSKSVNFNQASRFNSALKGVQNSDPSVLADGYDTYVTDSGVSVPKVLIPGLPEEPDGDSGAAISSCFWEWKPNFNVHYEASGSENINSPAVLFLPGFGVGSFHYEKQLKDLGRDYRVWAVDFLGQGMSLPVVDPTQSGGGESKNGNFLWGFGDKTEPWANQLVYSIDLWQDQVRYFIEEVHFSYIARCDCDVTSFKIMHLVLVWLALLFAAPCTFVCSSMHFVFFKNNLPFCLFHIPSNHFTSTSLNYYYFLLFKLKQ